MSENPTEFTHAEQAVLGAMLLNPEAIDTAAEILGSNGSMFQSPEGADTYDAIMALYKQNIPADPVTLWTYFEKQGRQNCATFVMELTEAVPTSHNAEHYANIVRDVFVRNKLMVACQQAMSDLKAKSKEVPEVLSSLEATVTSVAQSRAKKAVRKVADIMPNILSDIQARRNAKSVVSGIPTGLPAIDKAMLGLRPATLNFIGARPSVGKSALAANMAYHAAKAGHPVLVFSLEMQAESVVKRLLSIDQDMSYFKFCDPVGVATKDRMLSHAAISLGGLPLYLDDTPYMTMWAFRSRVRAFCRKHTERMPLVIADYLQLFGVDNKKDKRYEALGELTREMKVLAGELSIPIVMLSQLGREADTIDDPFRCLALFRESGNIEQDADTAIVMLRHVPEFAEKAAVRLDIPIEHIVDCALVKNRDGDVGRFPLWFDKPTQRMTAIADLAKPPTQTEIPDSPTVAVEEYYEEEEDDDVF